MDEWIIRETFWLVKRFAFILIEFFGKSITINDSEDSAVAVNINS